MYDNLNLFFIGFAVLLLQDNRSLKFGLLFLKNGLLFLKNCYPVITPYNASVIGQPQANVCCHIDNHAKIDAIHCPKIN